MGCFADGLPTNSAGGHHGTAAISSHDTFGSPLIHATIGYVTGSPGWRSSRAARVRRNEHGQGTLEYALILGAIALLAIGGLQLLGKNSNTALCSTSKGLGYHICGTLTGWQFPAANYAGGNGSNTRTAAVGPDGNIWFPTIGGAAGHEDYLAVVSTAGVVLHNYALGDFGPVAPNALSIAAGPDGAMWFSAPSFHTIGRIDMSGTISYCSFTGFTVAAADPTDIITGPDNNLWFTDGGAGTVTDVNTSCAQVHQWSPGAGIAPSWLTVGGDGAVWYTMESPDQIGRIDPNTLANTPNVASLPASAGNGGGLNGGVTIVSGGQGNATQYFADWTYNRLGSVSVAGGATEYQIPGTTPAASLYTAAMVAGNDGYVYISTWGLSTVNQFNIATKTWGAQYTETGNAVGPFSMVMGPDHNIWISDLGGFGFGIPGGYTKLF